MSGLFNLRRGAIVAALAAFTGYQFQDVLYRPLVVLGVTRPVISTPFADGDFVAIKNTRYCEDIHLHAPSQTLFTACDGPDSPRMVWFPPLGIFEDGERGGKNQGTLQVIDPKTMKTRVLKLEGFTGSFTTHGIDVLEDPDQPVGKAVYIFAVNHRPNAAHFGANGSPDAHKGRSVVEVFHHVIGSDSAQHLRTIFHDLIRTPNDIVALSPLSFLVTNDHYHREGHMRTLEDLYFRAKWTDTIRVDFKVGDAIKKDTDGVEATVALQGIHNNNGIGRGRTDNEIALVSTVSGVLNLVDFSRPGNDADTLIKEKIHLDSTLDNPSYFSDPYYSEVSDTSGFVLAGLSHAKDFGRFTEPGFKHGAIVWKVSPAKGKEPGSPDYWEKKIIFQDDGNRLNTGTVAVIVAIDPTKEKGKRKGWLFATGFISENIVAAKIDL